MAPPSNSSIGREVRSHLNKALYDLIRDRKIVIEFEGSDRSQLSGTVRMNGTPKVVVRTAGDRDFWEIPPSELGAMMKDKHQAMPSAGPEDAYREVLAHYGVSRLTTNIRAELDRILRLVDTREEEPDR